MAGPLLNIDIHRPQGSCSKVCVLGQTSIIVNFLDKTYTRILLIYEKRFQTRVYAFSENVIFLGSFDAKRKGFASHRTKYNIVNK